MLNKLIYLGGFGAVVASAASVEQVHLGLTTSVVNCPNGISATFASSTSSSMTVTYAAHGLQSQTTTTTVDSYTYEGKNYSYTSPYLHKAQFCNLNSSTIYTYTIGKNANKPLFQRSFITPPTTGDNTVPTVLGMVGDIGSKKLHATLQNIASGLGGVPAQVVIVLGDLSYANGEQEQWDLWYNQSQNVFSTIPSLTINGNHETIKGGGASSPKHKKKFPPENYVSYIHRANNPVPAAQNKQLRTYYSIDIGLVHCVFLDDYAGSRGAVKQSDDWLSERNVQLKWLKTDLSGVDRKKTPWVLVFKHNPFYSTWQAHQCQCGPQPYIFPDSDKCWNGIYDDASPSEVGEEPHCANQAKFEDVYLQYKVDMVVSGHTHAYERTAPIVKNKIDTKNGITYMITGAAGFDFDTDRVAKIPDWSVKAITNLAGGTRISATSTTLNVAWVANEDNQVYDEFALTKENTATTQHPTTPPTTAIDTLIESM
ncbi:hypothetical protein THRCLA_09333 [Thraustotheca clavata]|uniref:Purple acid phosphatase n=1 Tax=Thraustotheca clavata TaxID=74557 RepID=A0A1V9YXD1_9STRA|nr:hypothetical protein THRCLA_09333 [Thraustotheca clavata]